MKYNLDFKYFNELKFISRSRAEKLFDNFKERYENFLRAEFFEEEFIEVLFSTEHYFLKDIKGFSNGVTFLFNSKETFKVYFVKNGVRHAYNCPAEMVFSSAENSKLFNFFWYYKGKFGFRLEESGIEESIKENILNEDEEFIVLSTKELEGIWKSVKFLTSSKVLEYYLYDSSGIKVF